MSLAVLDQTLDPALSYALRGFLALLFARAVVGKLSNPSEFTSAVRGYELVPAALAPAVAAALLVVEISIVPLLLVPRFGSLAALFGAGLLALYAAAIGINLARGRRDIDCGCSGPASRQALHEVLLGRNAFYIAVGLMAALAPSARTLIWLDGVSIALAVLALGILAVGLDGLAALASRGRLGESRR